MDYQEKYISQIFLSYLIRGFFSAKSIKFDLNINSTISLVNPLTKNISRIFVHQQNLLTDRNKICHNIFLKGVPKMAHSYLRVRGIAFFESFKNLILTFLRANFIKINLFSILIFLTNQYKSAHVIIFLGGVVLPHVASDHWVWKKPIFFPRLNLKRRWIFQKAYLKNNYIFRLLSGSDAGSQMPKNIGEHFKKSPHPTQRHLLEIALEVIIRHKRQI